MKKLVALAVITAALTTINLYSQPQIVISLTGGYNLPLPDLKGNLPDSLGGPFADSLTYLVNQGFNFGATGKYALGKKRNVRINLGFTYNMFSQSKDYSSGSVSTAIKQKINAINISAGVEYAFQPKAKVNPYLGLDLGTYLYSGEFTSSGFFNLNQKLKSATRFGGAIGGGIEFQFSKQVGANVGFKYHLANLIGKEFDSAAVTSTQWALNDKEYTVDNTTVKSRNIQYLQLSAGISFFLNQPRSKRR